MRCKRYLICYVIILSGFAWHLSLQLHSIPLSNFPYYFAWVASCQTMRRNISCYNASRTNNRASANCNWTYIQTSEIEIGDNDTLGAVVSKSLNANLYIILSDINGLYTSDPSKEKNAKLIQVVDTIDDSILKLAGDSSSKVGTGGMITKLQAAQIVTKANCDMVIANGKNPDILYDIMENQFIGTLFKKEVKE